MASLHPFNPESVADFYSSDMKFIEVKSGGKLYDLLLKIIAEKGCQINSFGVDVVPAARKKTLTTKRVLMKAGLGKFSFSDSTGQPLWALHERLGDPVGSSCGIEIYTSLIVFTKGTAESLAGFFSDLIEASEKAEPGLIQFYSWHIKHSYWREGSKVRSRPLHSVILPEKLRQGITDDLDRFLSPEAQDFYVTHGIPYRRSYLFHGVPGAGKTSLIQALAGHYNRSISFLQPTHPDMTDDSLRSAMSDLPEDTIVVLEDIDSLFAKDRSTKNGKSNLTFSGLLNALDGIGSPNGQIYILTTNLRDQLDAALIRNGRVDFQVHFGFATDEQVMRMWSSFYPQASGDAAFFCSELRRHLDGRQLSTAGLQHYFVLQMRSSPEEAVAKLNLLIEDMNMKESDDQADAARKAKAAALFNVDDKVEANYKDKGKWFSGTIANNNGDGTFDITYDDKDTEFAVSAILIRGRQNKESSGSADEVQVMGSEEIASVA